MKPLVVFCLLLLFSPMILVAQEVAVFAQFNGQYDYLAFGNTLNTGENTGAVPPTPCEILTSSSANFELQPDQQLIAAYLYWAGSGTGDFEVTLNGAQITAQRTFSETISNGLVYFAAFADVTSLVQTTGNSLYTLADLDLTGVIAPYCENTTNFAGWAITVIYQDSTLPLNQVTVFDGLESVSATNTNLTINLSNINVLDNDGAKIGFLAWEGDQSLSVNETLQINGNIISNPPLNPADNAFNGTNSFTQNELLYNMDIDFYSIENNISPGDTSAVINLTSGQDFVMINTIITVLNSQLPDATISIDTVQGGDICGDRDLEITYTVYNLNCTDALPSGTPIAFYGDTTLVGQSQTTDIIPISGQQTNTITLTIPIEIGPDFQLNVFVDDNGAGVSTVYEIIEDNNQDTASITLLELPEQTVLQDLEICDVIPSLNFDLTQGVVQADPLALLSFYETNADAVASQNTIENPTNYTNIQNPQEIFIRADNTQCYLVNSFTIAVLDCSLPDATIVINGPLNTCREETLEVQYTVYNTLGTGPLPSNTPIAFYIDEQLVMQAQTQEIIAIGDSQDGFVEIVLDASIPNNFTFLAAVDDTGVNQGIVEERNETNNHFTLPVTFLTIDPIAALPDLLLCNEGFNSAVFDLTLQNDLISSNTDDIIRFYTSLENALSNSFAITNPSSYQSLSAEQEIFVRLDTAVCFAVSSFWITIENCPPFVPQGFSPNRDSINDVFEISGLLNIYENFELKIYSRDGTLIYIGGNAQGFWNAIPNTGLLYEKKLVPVGTYYYVLLLNDPSMPTPLIGYVYVNY
ncbi:gliding motility-associated C-terminal domain-containing protein [Flavobacteriaceae bacterium]|nr:gliding motility-associated C-terminal domain-containing protein [Flavobacteriaceae bacterium]